MLLLLIIICCFILCAIYDFLHPRGCDKCLGHLWLVRGYIGSLGPPKRMNLILSSLSSNNGKKLQPRHDWSRNQVWREAGLLWSDNQYIVWSPLQHAKVPEGHFKLGVNSVQILTQLEHTLAWLEHILS